MGFDGVSLKAETIFRTFARRRVRGLTLLAAFAIFVGFLACLSLLSKDTSITALLSKNEPALIYRDKVSEVFGMKSPLMVAVIADNEQDKSGSIFSPEGLAVVDWLSREIKKTPNIDPGRVRSLATSTRIAGEGDRLIIEPLFEEPPVTAEGAAAVAAATRAMRPYAGLLYGKDGRGALIAAEMIDPAEAGKTYETIRRLAARAPPGFDVEVAGIGAAGGYLSRYLNRDTAKMLPLGSLATILVLAWAFRTAVGVAVPILVIAFTVAGTIGIMALCGVPYFVITNALPAILIGISVADSLHIVSVYYEHKSNTPTLSAGALATRTLSEMWRPITLTSITTIAGFLGIAATTNAPPMMWFGLFGALGVAIAYVVTLVFLPAGLAAFGRRQSPPFRDGIEGQVNDPAVKVVRALSRAAFEHPWITVGIAACIVVVGVIGMTKVEVNDHIMEQFQYEEPIRIADRMINKHFAGSTYIDVVIETEDAEGMTDPSRLAKVDALQQFMRKLPHVQSVTSIVDYVKQLNQALDGGAPQSYALPTSAEAVAQELLLLTANSEPTEWSDKIDTEQRRILVRAYTNSGLFTDGRAIIEPLQAYIDSHVRSPDMAVNLTGSIYITYSWLKPLGKQHTMSVVISLALVFAVSALLFRSVALGFLTVLPVVASILLTYSCMGFLGLPLNAATSMFAAISVGLGVDFAIHMVDRVSFYMKTENLSLAAALERVHPTSGRALFLNAAAIFFGFGVVCFSELPIMQRFGALVALAVLSSFITALTLIPALMRLFHFRPLPSMQVAVA